VFDVASEIVERVPKLTIFSTNPRWLASFTSEAMDASAAETAGAGELATDDPVAATVAQPAPNTPASRSAANRTFIA
jgi:hypothetical protein